MRPVIHHRDCGARVQGVAWACTCGAITDPWRMAPPTEREAVVLRRVRSAGRPELQRIVQDWARRAFPRLFNDPGVRRRRFLEEALELFQSLGGEESEVDSLASYVFGRPVGHPPQEIGGVMVTLYSLAEMHGFNVEEAERVEIERVLTKPIEHFQRRDAEKVGAGL